MYGRFDYWQVTDNRPYYFRRWYGKEKNRFWREWPAPSINPDPYPMIVYPIQVIGYTSGYGPITYSLAVF